MRIRFWTLALAGLAACSSEESQPGPIHGETLVPLPVLGNGSHDVADVTLTTIGTSAEGLVFPRDLALNPLVAGELWVVNAGGAPVVVYSNAGNAGQLATTFPAVAGTEHFMPNPSGLAFSDHGHFATIHEEDRQTQAETPPDFMGPTLWPGDVAAFDAGHDSHLDMLHDSPDGMGIAWEQGDVYWVFDGWHGSLTRYDFVIDHGPGGADHSDGIVRRYVELEVERVPGVPSHAAFEPETKFLYVADTGNHRIAVLDTTTGSEGDETFPNYDDSDQRAVDDAVLRTLVDTADNGAQLPSGMVLTAGYLFVSDNGSGAILAYTHDGRLVDYLLTGVATGGIMGLEADAAGNLYFVDASTSSVVRIAPR
jgi:hypothetical protein